MYMGYIKLDVVYIHRQRKKWLAGFIVEMYGDDCAAGPCTYEVIYWQEY